jgi:PAS domain S-box-containing protein
VELPILAFNNNGIILMVNSEWERISGYSREEVEGKNELDGFCPSRLSYKDDGISPAAFEEPDSVPNKYEAVFMNKNWC